MPIRSSVVLAISACLNAALLIGCADGGSSATHLATTVPAAAQQGTVAGAQATPGRSVHSSNRRTLSVPSCIGFTGPDAFIGINNSSADAGQYSVVGGGQNNEACDSWGTVVGGCDRERLAERSFGRIRLHRRGHEQHVSGEGAIHRGRRLQYRSGEGAVVDGGFNSTAAGTFATIPGGYVNSAAGTYSFAAGARASAAQTGTFVWSDGSDGDTILTSSRAYQFLARASGGFTLYTNAASTVGAQLAAGSGTWASLSDRNVKTNIAPLDDAAVLDKVAALPISRWSYKSEHGVRHVGPMAQDFYAAFGVGEDDKHITSIDEDGVALAAIKALHRQCFGGEERAAARSVDLAVGEDNRNADTASAPECADRRPESALIPPHHFRNKSPTSVGDCLGSPKGRRS
jgi:hypothetical protein